MVAGSALPLCCDCCRWVKIAKPQDYAKSPGLPPCTRAGGKEGGWGAGQARVSPPRRPRQAPAPSSFPLARPESWEELSQAGGKKVDSVGGPGPTPPSHKGPGECPARPIKAGWAVVPPHLGAVLSRAGGRGTLPSISGVLTHRLLRTSPSPGMGMGRAQGRASREASPWQAADCSACSTPQVTFHQHDKAKLHQTGTARWPLPPQDGQEGAPFKCPCRGFCQPQRPLGGAGQREEAGRRSCLASFERAPWPRGVRKVDTSAISFLKSSQTS